MYFFPSQNGPFVRVPEKEGKPANAAKETEEQGFFGLDLPTSRRQTFRPWRDSATLRFPFLEE